ncbi:MAG: tRNA lysidine(34) synthetase TilS, partial [Flavobacteriales bacterium]|nr:tRNA lysidine(34) synthetase TilS [Flavobacteriales bacterium]
YQLRGKHSEQDEMLVKNWAAENGIPFHCKKIETKKLVEESNNSVQMVAREERYRFFYELMQKHKYAVTALAHHADDRVESLLMNVLRGTGIRGLVGMPVKREKYVRPLLFSNKKEIRDYAKKHTIPFREDASNASIDYKRNWVRLRLLPMLRKKDSSIDEKLFSFCKRAENELPNYGEWVEKERGKLVSNDEISIPKLSSHRYPFTILKEILKPKGFSSDQVFQLLGMLESESGTAVSSAAFCVAKDRERFIVSEKNQNDKKPKLTFNLLERDEVSTIKTPPHIALIDADLVGAFGNVPELKLRKWNTGDRFKPLGMHGWKKLSDFFIDEKMSILEKQQIWLLIYMEEIIWVVGRRSDDRFKVTSETKKVLKVIATLNQ